MEGRIDSAQFEEFFRDHERPVRLALVARLGFDTGRDAAAEAFTYAWEHWDRVATMSNPAGYVYRVGERIGRRARKRLPVEFLVPDGEESPLPEPGLAPALAALSARQRTTVVLVHGLGWTHRQTAEFLSLSTSSVQKHAERAIAKLRRSLGVSVEF